MRTIKYYRISLKDSFFNTATEKRLRAISGGETFTIIYLKIHILSINNGATTFNFSGYGRDVIDELAFTIDEDVDNVTLVLLYLADGSLVDLDDKLLEDK